VVRALLDVLRRHRVDLVHSHEFTMAVYGAAAARLAGVPHVITMHGGRYYASSTPRRLAIGAAARMSGGVVAVSDSVAANLRRDLRLDGARVPVIRNGVRPTPRVNGTLRAELKLAPTDRLVLAVGNLYPVKGHATLISALAELTVRIPQAHVAIAGRGDLHDALERQARESGVGSRVHLLGFRADIGNLLASADAFALSSRSEGLPLALLEAMFAGLPIVATDVGEVAGALGEHAGVVVPPDDPALFAAALDVVLRDPRTARALGAAALRRAREEFTLALMVERYAQRYARQLGVGAE
jgi:glycosyltransferase involved in cell wall biosynthesis